MNLIDSRQFIPYAPPLDWPGEVTYTDMTADEIRAHVKAHPLIAREVLPSFPNQCGTIRVDSLAGTYDYFSSRFNQLKS